MEQGRLDFGVGYFLQRGKEALEREGSTVMRGVLLREIRSMIFSIKD